MSELIRFPLDAGSVVVEVRDEDGFDRIARPGAIATASRSFLAALDEVRAAAQAALDVFRTMPGDLDSIEMEFGVRLTAEAGAVIARTTVEGQLGVRLTWRAQR